MDNPLKYAKSSLFCYNGYRHALFKILFLWISSRFLRKALTKENEKKKNVNDFFIGSFDENKENGIFKHIKHFCCSLNLKFLLLYGKPKFFNLIRYCKKRDMQKIKMNIYSISLVWHTTTWIKWNFSKILKLVYPTSHCSPSSHKHCKFPSLNVYKPQDIQKIKNDGCSIH